MPQSNKNSAQPVSMPVHPRSAQRSLVKVESGIKGLLPTSWAPPIYSVSLLTKLRCALAGNSSFACDSCSLVPRSHLPNAKTRRKKKSEKTRQGLYNVGFIGLRIAKTASGLRGNEGKMPSSARKTVVCFRYAFY